MMNWLELLRLTQQNALLNQILIEPTKLHHLVLLVKTWEQVHLQLLTATEQCLECGLVGICYTTTLLDSVL